MAPAGVVAIGVALVACGPRGDTTVRLGPTSAAVLNPERGFYVDIDLVDGRDFSHVRAGGSTLGFAFVRLDAWRTEALPAALLDALGAGFEAARDAGIKVILHFAYNRAADGADAPKWAMLAHVAQLAPLLQEHADVIAALHAGFIGAWGEWHGSTHGLDNPTDRGDLLWALLTALPPSRSALIRSPIYKAAAYGDPLDEARAFDGSHPARVGHLNNCALASDTDLGTYAEPIERWKAYVAREGRFTPVGGETCRLAPPRTDCGTAVAELRRLHWSFLNLRYHPDVIDTWRRQGCLDEIGRELGYRLEVESVTLPAAVVPGGTFEVTIRLRNTGYAPMFNPRPVYLTIDDHRILLPDDPRRWEAHATIHARVPVPADLAPGRHRLGLWLPDADARLRTPARVAHFAVRIANTRWEGSVNVLTDALVVAPP